MAVYIGKAGGRIFVCFFHLMHLPCFQHGCLFRGSAFPGTLACMYRSSGKAFRYELPLWELLLIYFPPAFLLSSLCALFGICFTGEHIATLSCGLVWLTVLLMRSLLRIPGAEYVYLFIRYAHGQNSVWLWNKGIVTAIGLFLWGIIYAECIDSKRRLSYDWR